MFILLDCGEKVGVGVGVGVGNNVGTGVSVEVEDGLIDGWDDWITGCKVVVGDGDTDEIVGGDGDTSGDIETY